MNRIEEVVEGRIGLKWADGIEEIEEGGIGLNMG